MVFIELALLQLADEGRQGELMGFGRSLQVDGLRHPLNHTPAKVPVPLTAHGAAAHSALEMNA